MLLLFCTITTACHSINTRQNKQTKIAVNAEPKQSKMRQAISIYSWSSCNNYDSELPRRIYARFPLLKLWMMKIKVKFPKDYMNIEGYPLQCPSRTHTEIQQVCKNRFTWLSSFSAGKSSTLSSKYWYDISMVLNIFFCEKHNRMNKKQGEKCFLTKYSHCFIVLLCLLFKRSHYKMFILQTIFSISWLIPHVSTVFYIYHQINYWSVLVQGTKYISMHILTA